MPDKMTHAQAIEGVETALDALRDVSEVAGSDSDTVNDLFQDLMQACSNLEKATKIEVKALRKEASDPRGNTYDEEDDGEE